MFNEKIKFLVIDDDESTNFLTSYLFKEINFEYDISFELSAESALQKLYATRTNLPDIILLDINLPGMNGWEFLTKLHHQNRYFMKSIPIFILSSSVFENDKIKSRGFSDVIDYIEKPLSVSKINLIYESFLIQIHH